MLYIISNYDFIVTVASVFAVFFTCIVSYVPPENRSDTPCHALKRLLEVYLRASRT